MRGTSSSRFVSSYGFFVKPGVYNNRAVIVCTTCHDPTLHSGSFEHLQTNAETVKAHLPPAKEGEDEFPLAEDGKISVRNV